MIIFLVKRGIQAIPSIQLITSPRITAMEDDIYICSGLYDAEKSFEERATVRVRGKDKPVRQL